ncbi:hypothetical protein KKH39_01445 [Patescibacteria group bacterium]|nr:hypothetical protein [Patescibacteria group bacterium]
MKKNINIFLIIFVLLLTGCSSINKENSEQVPTINNNELSCNDLFKKSYKITAAMNYCESDSDCLIVEDYLFGCYYLANKDADEAPIKQLTKDYNYKNCPPVEFDCYNVGLTVKCQNGQCVANDD